MSKERRPRPFARREHEGVPTALQVDALGNELRALPELEAPNGLWERVRDRLDDDAGAPRPQGRWVRQASMAFAASVAVIAAAAILVSVDLSSGDIEPVDNTGVADNRTPRVSESLDHLASIEALMEQSRLAEERRRAVLAFYSPSGPEQVLRAHIGGIDAALNEQMFAGAIEPESREALLRDRVDLIADLTDIERFRQHEFVRQVSF